jgi:hypothetical protein
MVARRFAKGLERRFGRAAPLAGAAGALLALAVAAAPPLGYRTAPAARPLADPVGGTTSDPGGETAGGTSDPGDGTPTGGETTDGGTTGGTDIRNEPGYVECTAEAPIRLAPNVCGNRATVDAIDNGWNLTVNPDGTYAWTPPPTYDPATGGWGAFDGASQTCDPNIQVKLRQAALAGSQLARAISDRQLAYAQTDPIEAVNNPKKDGAGGVCTIDLFAFDLGRLLGGTYDQIKNLIDALSHFSVDSLFGAACKVVNTVFGDLQNRLLADLQSNSPLSQFQQFVSQITVGYVAPLASFTGNGLTPRPTTAGIPGLLTGNPLQVSYVPGKGYVYMADLGSGNLLVVKVSQTPLAPADAVSPGAR